MEIGHNVLHGQWDWMNDPVINSRRGTGTRASTAEAWKHSHNYIHHTYTNIRGKDKDLGYEIMRIDPHQQWHPVYLRSRSTTCVLMALFEWGVAFHDLDLDAIRAGEKSKEEVAGRAQGHRPQGARADRQGLHRLAALSAGCIDGDRRRALGRAKDERALGEGAAARAAAPGAADEPAAAAPSCRR